MTVPFRRMLTALFALAGIALLVPTQAAVADPTPSRPDGFSLAEDGATLVHDGSGLRFPTRIGAFVRTDEKGFDPSGEYIAIAYDRPLSGGEVIAVRMAMVHIEAMTASEHYAAMKPLAPKYFSAITVKSEGPFDIPTQPGVSAYRGVFTGERNGHPWNFNLTTIDYGTWGGRISTAYPAAQAAQAQAELDDFIGAFRWQRPTNAETR